MLARRFRTEPDAVPESWPLVTMDGDNDNLLRMCGALDSAGHQALPWAGTRTREGQLSYRSSFYQATGA